MNYSKRVTYKNLSPNVRDMKYPSRGYMSIRPREIEKELEKGVNKPFNTIIDTGIAFGWEKPPITFVHQTLAAVSYPHLIENSNFPEDVKTKARQFLNACAFNFIGSYTLPKGVQLVRNLAAEFIEKRDGFPSNPEDIFLANGACPAILSVLKLLRNNENGNQSGVMVPIPEYLLFSSLLTDLGIKKISYCLDEANNWSVNISELLDVYNDASLTCTPVGIVVVNPGNPTNQVLSRDNIEQIVKFAYDNSLYILADEVYQQNVYLENKFHSFKKVSTEMGEPYSKIELASFMSCSKGYLGEAGVRAGYVEAVNMDDEVKELYYRSLVVNLCPNTYGQVCLFCVFNEPKEGEPSYDLFVKEKKSVLDDLKTKGKLMVDTLNTLDGVRCTPMEGAVWAMPSIALPPNAIKAARESNMKPDTFYALQLLENAGISLLSGSETGQKPGTYHVRTSILLETETLTAMLERLKKFHVDFMDRYM